MSTEARALQLAEAAVARLCHDVSGAIGAVLNGLELATSDPVLAAEALELAGQAARESAARLRLARALWNVEAVLDLAELPRLLEGLPNRGRLQLDLAGLTGALPPHSARLLLAAMIAGAEALHGPGVISLGGAPAQEILVMIDGPRAAWPPELARLIAYPHAVCDDLAPRGLAVRLMCLFAHAAGARLSLLLCTDAPSAPAPLLLRFAEPGAA